MPLLVQTLLVAIVSVHGLWLLLVLCYVSCQLY